jgi:hypothetical protein
MPTPNIRTAQRSLCNAMIDPLPIGVEAGVYSNCKPSMILPFEPRAGEALFTQLFEVPLSFFGFRGRRKDNRALPLRAGCRFNAVGTRVSDFNDALSRRKQPECQPHIPATTSTLPLKS